jgi:arginine:ornithine antiporter/lysine permease
MKKENIRVLGFVPLLAVVVGAIVGSGIYNSPADLARVANPGWIAVAWAITGLGMYSLAMIFQYLARRRPDLEGGIYSYAREAAGEFAGFNSAYGYWWSALFTNIAYFFVVSKVLGLYVPLLAQSKWAVFVFSSVLLWGYAGLIRSGLKKAGMINVAVTALKLVPLVVVAAAAVARFRPALAGNPFARVLASSGAPAPAWSQLSAGFGVMVFAFMGIEGAVVISAKARRAADVGRATGIGFLVTLAIYVLVSTLAGGVVPAAVIVRSASPLGTVLGEVWGGFGRGFLDFGFLFSVLGALLSWLMLTAETPSSAARERGSFPRAFARTSVRAVPVFSLAVTAGITQAILFLLCLFSRSADIAAPGNVPLLQNLYFGAISISVVCALVPYLFSALLGARLARAANERAPVIWAALAMALFAWMFAVMAVYTAAALVIYTSGAALRLRFHHERRQPPPRGEILFYAVLLAASVVVLIMVGRGQIRF